MDPGHKARDDWLVGGMAEAARRRGQSVAAAMCISLRVAAGGPAVIAVGRSAANAGARQHGVEQHVDRRAWSSSRSMSSFSLWLMPPRQGVNSIVAGHTLVML